MNTDVHLEALGEFLTQQRTHLTGSAASKGTYGDYLRLLEFYRESRGEQIRELIISWVGTESGRKV
jgi:hypothetical protein